jgi:hypothetical protein
MYITENEGLGLWISPAWGVDIDYTKAVRLNRYYRKALSWDKEYPRILRLLGYTTTPPPDEEAFAQQVAFWQRGQGFEGKDIDGIIGKTTWARMQSAINATQTQKSPLVCSAINGQARYLLKYEGSPGKERCITLDDDEFRKNFVSLNIDEYRSTIDRASGKIIRFELNYTDGRKKLFDPVEMTSIPIMYKFSAGARVAQPHFLDYFLMKKDGFIYEVFDGKIRYSIKLSPNIARVWSDLLVRARALKDLWDLGFITAQFAMIIGSYGQALSTIKSVQQRAFDPTALKLLESM